MLRVINTSIYIWTDEVMISLNWRLLIRCTTKTPRVNNLVGVCEISSINEYRFINNMYMIPFTKRIFCFFLSRQWLGKVIPSVNIAALHWTLHADIYSINLFKIICSNQAEQSTDNLWPHKCCSFNKAIGFMRTYVRPGSKVEFYMCGI